MRIEKIGENKIRIFVTFDDLEERDIDLSSFNYNSPETQELFWDLMEQAELELGFETHESQLCIEAVTDVEQGFVITITRIDDDGDFESLADLAGGWDAPYHVFRYCENRKADIYFLQTSAGSYGQG